MDEPDRAPAARPRSKRPRSDKGSRVGLGVRSIEQGPSSREAAHRTDPGESIPAEGVFRVSVALDPWTLSINKARRAGIRRGRGGAKRGKPIPYTYATEAHKSARELLTMAIRREVIASGLTYAGGGVSVLLISRGTRRARKHTNGEPIAFGDVDGPEKAALDCLKAGGALGDDVQVVRYTLEKELSNTPLVHLEIRRMDYRP